eukprot:8675792-Alexandrium_andersonii.AAC.1
MESLEPDEGSSERALPGDKVLRTLDSPSTLKEMARWPQRALATLPPEGVAVVKRSLKKAGQHCGWEVVAPHSRSRP